MPFFNKQKRRKDDALTESADFHNHKLRSLYTPSSSSLDKMKPQETFQMIEFPPASEGKYHRGYQMGRPALVRKGGQYRISYKGENFYILPGRPTFCFSQTTTTTIVMIIIIMIEEGCFVNNDFISSAINSFLQSMPAQHWPNFVFAICLHLHVKEPYLTL